MIPAWKDAPVAIVTRDTVRLLEVTLRFPPDAPAGGLVRVTQWQDKDAIGEIAFALTAGETDALRSALTTAVRQLLEARGVVAASAQEVLVASERTEAPAPAPAPDLGRL